MNDTPDMSILDADIIAYKAACWAEANSATLVLLFFLCARKSCAIITILYKNQDQKQMILLESEWDLIQ